MQHTTIASETACRACRRPLLHAWDEGLLVRADADALAAPVAEALRLVGCPIYALTRGGDLILEAAERLGTIPGVISRHAEHACRGVAR